MSTAISISTQGFHSDADAVIAAYRPATCSDTQASSCFQTSADEFLALRAYRPASYRYVPSIASMPTPCADAPDRPQTSVGNRRGEEVVNLRFRNVELQAGVSHTGSLIETEKMNDVDPYAYLNATLTAVSDGHPASQIDELLPWTTASLRLKSRWRSHRLHSFRTWLLRSAKMRRLVPGFRRIFPNIEVPFMVSALDRNSAEIEYHGIRGDSLACRDAVFRLVQYGTRITDARILTSGQSHSLLLSINSGDMVAIKSGFASGYSGTGPTTFSEVLGVLHAVGAEIDEFDVDSHIVKRINETALTTEDVSRIVSSRAVRPQRWPDYVLNEHWTDHEIDAKWDRFPPVVPFAVIDPRIMGLAISFWDEPDDALMKGYRRLEDIIRKRIDSEEYGSRLLNEAFSVNGGKLKWMDALGRSHAGRLDLMKGTFNSYRNVRAHRDSENSDDADLLAEFLLLNHLYRLEGEAVDEHGDYGNFPKSAV